MNENSTAQLLAIVVDHWSVIAALVVFFAGYVTLKTEFREHKREMTDRVNRLENRIEGKLNTIETDIKKLLARD